MTNEKRRKAAEWFRNRAKNCPMSGAKRMYEIATEALEERERNEQTHWIPCSERMPEEDEDVLVCSEEGDIDIACWMPEQWTDEPHIEWWSGEYRVDAVAWMPLPEPYGGENDD